MKRRAVPLVEILIAAALAGIVGVAAWTLFLADHRHIHRNIDRLGSIQGASLLAQTLRLDLGKLALFNPDGAGTAADRSRTMHLNRPVVIDDEGRRLSFLMARPETNMATGVPTVRVTYRFDVASSRIIREAGGSPAEIRSAVVDDVVFELVALHPSAGRLGTGPPPFTYHARVPIHVLKVQITCKPDNADRRRATRQLSGQDDRCTVIAAIPLAIRGDRAYHPYWMYGPAEVPEKPRASNRAGS
jgi:hypothetical protein